jgi:hypothetical protein
MDHLCLVFLYSPNCPPAIGGHQSQNVCVPFAGSPFCLRTKIQNIQGIIGGHETQNLYVLFSIFSFPLNRDSENTRHQGWASVAESVCSTFAVSHFSLRKPRSRSNVQWIVGGHT